MIKKLALTVIFLVFAATLVACDGDSAPDPDRYMESVLGITEAKAAAIVATPTVKPYDSPSLIPMAISTTCKAVGNTFAVYMGTIAEEVGDSEAQVATRCHELLTSEVNQYGWPDDSARDFNGISSSKSWVFAHTLLIEAQKLGYGLGMSDYEDGVLVSLMAQNIADGEP